MAITGVHLFFIMLIFLFGIGGLVVFFYRYKFQVANRLAKDLGFTAYLGTQNIPTEIVQFGEYIREFREFEWVVAGEVGGQKIYVAQYFLNRPTQYIYRFVVFSPFAHIRTDIVAQEEKVSLTQSGVYVYKVMPWTLKKETVWPVIEQVVQAKSGYES